MPTLPGQVTGTASIPVDVRIGRKTVELDGCLVWTGATTEYGYGEMTVRGKRIGVHRAAYELAHGPIPPGQMVLHRCDNPPCCNVAHLFLGTQADNMADKAAKGRAASRSRNGASRLAEGQYDDLERWAAAGVPQVAIADRLGVSPQAVCQYLQRRRALVTG